MHRTHQDHLFSHIFSLKIWACFGTAIVSIAGIVFFGERLDMAKVVCLSLIVVGVVGLELTDSH